jgi:NOL1/NOP2/sun family putative RNA methylase
VTALPPAFIDRMARLLGPQLDEFLTALGCPDEGLRVNTLRLTPRQFEKIAPFAVVALPFPPEGFLLRPEVRAGRHPYHAAGLYYLQDPSAMAVGALVDPRPGECVLDLAAAPGGKTTHLAARMENTGLLVANDVHRGRAQELAGNLERCGVRNTMVVSERADRLVDRFRGYFDRVLVDAPCSGESMFHKSAAALAGWNIDAVEGCARRQSDLLRTAADMVAPGGLLVYSTCTFAEEENEQVVENYLSGYADFELAALPMVPGSESVGIAAGIEGFPAASGHRRAGGSPTGLGCGDGGAAAAESASDAEGARVPSADDRKEAQGRDAELRERPASSMDGGEAPGTGVYRFWPHRYPGAGHFVAAFRRAGEQSTGGCGGSVREWRETARPESLSLLERFRSEVYPEMSLDVGRVIEMGGELFELPEAGPLLRGLSIVRPGLWLGSIRPGRFEPAHALALAISPSTATDRLDLARDDPRVELYLAGHTLDSEGPPGWLPVTVDGFALGWGKRVGRTVKNHYPKGLRRL